MTKAQARELMRNYRDSQNGNDGQKDEEDDNAKDGEQGDQAENEDQDDGAEEAEEAEDGADSDAPDDSDGGDGEQDDDKSLDLRERATKGWLGLLLTLCNNLEAVEADYPSDPSTVRQYISKKSLPDVVAARNALCRITDRLQRDLNGEQAGNATDPEQSVEAHKAAYAASDTDISIPTFLRREPTATTEPVVA